MKAAAMKILRLACLIIISLASISWAAAAEESLISGPQPSPSMETALSLEPAPPSEPGSRPKIGLALSGGGAKGFAHIGVLKWLEENRIPVDFIAGTSMGGLIGGIYAMGMSPTDIEQLCKSLNWDRIFDANPPFNAFDFRRKQDRLDFPLEIGLRDLIFVPNGMSAYRVDLLLSRLALPYYDLHNFDELPIPYRCVATDLVNSEKMIIQKGPLSGALRATMSVPGAFTPVEFEGRVLADGGLVDNVPVDVTQSMGANLIIAVNCVTDNQGMDMRRIDSVLLGAMNTVLIDNSNRFLELADCVIRPEIGKLSYFDWKEIERFIAAGYLAADQRADELKKYQVSVSTWEEYVQRRLEKKPVQIPIPEDLEIQGANKLQQDEIRKQLQRFIGQPIDAEALEAALNQVMGLGLYESIRYQVTLRDQIPILQIQVKEKPYGPPFIGFTVDTSIVDSQVELNLKARLTSFDILGAGSELRSDLSLGTDPRLNVELYQPISKYGLFVAPRFGVDQYNQGLFNQEEQINDFQVGTSSLGLDLGCIVNQFSELRFGYEISYQNVRTKIGPAIPDMNGLVRKLGLRWSFRSIADETFSDGALFWDIKGNWYTEAPNALEPFDTAEGSMKWTVPVNDQNIILMMIQVGATLKGQPPFLQQFTLGGPFRLGAYHQDELRGDNYYLGTIGWMKNLGMPIGLSNLHLAVFLENGGAFANWADTHCATCLSVGLIGPTTWGSFYLGTSLSEGKPIRINCLFGRVF